jgi:hypothetical protein
LPGLVRKLLRMHECANADDKTSSAVNASSSVEWRKGECCMDGGLIQEHIQALALPLSPSLSLSLPLSPSLSRVACLNHSAHLCVHRGFSTDSTESKKVIDPERPRSIIYLLPLSSCFCPLAIACLLPVPHLFIIPSSLGQRTHAARQLGLLFCPCAHVQ